MREIIFKGKIKGSGEWIEGNLATVKWWLDGSPITVIIPADAYLDPRSGQGTIRYVEVIPETVGQWSGRLDKNGKRIFEGDIVHQVSREGDFMGIMTFDCYGSFSTRWYKYEKYSIEKGFSLKDEDLFIEVLGNVHDNPELLT